MIAQSTPNDVVLAVAIQGGFVIMVGMVLGYMRWYFRGEAFKEAEQERAREEFYRNLRNDS